MEFPRTTAAALPAASMAVCVAVAACSAARDYCTVFVYVCPGTHGEQLVLVSEGGEGRLPEEQVLVAWVVEELGGELLEEMFVASLKGGPPRSWCNRPPGSATPPFSALAKVGVVEWQ
ncbi:hypothetical protein E2C01_037638 [Portunus trituberculatus]|uniref:Uncharacterized protein n=1 Tax=Portunus trituberculatus TaxID=210409 RepID=A0A5B7FFH3_PORTR|nr:hypothetical protein [Portunus trituberculatus]